MCYQIGKIYLPGFSLVDAKAVALSIGLACVAGKIVALEASILLGPFALAAKPAIGATIVKTLGTMVINYFEDLEEARQIS